MSLLYLGVSKDDKVANLITIASPIDTYKANAFAGPVARALSAACAAARARSAVTVMNAFRRGLSVAIRSRHHSVSATDVVSRRVSAPARSG